MYRIQQPSGILEVFVEAGVHLDKRWDMTVEQQHQLHRAQYLNPWCWSIRFCAYEVTETLQEANILPWPNEQDGPPNNIYLTLAIDNFRQFVGFRHDDFPCYRTNQFFCWCISMVHQIIQAIGDHTEDGFVRSYTTGTGLLHWGAHFQRFDDRPQVFDLVRRLLEKSVDEDIDTDLEFETNFDADEQAGLDQTMRRSKTLQNLDMPYSETSLLTAVFYNLEEMVRSLLDHGT